MTARARKQPSPSLWSPYVEPQDYVEFAGYATPGLAEVVGASSPRKWEKRESVGWSGAFLVYQGLELSSFSVRVRLFDDADWILWHEFAPVVQRVPLGRYQKPVDISHPLLTMLGIHSVVVEDVTQATQVEDGIWEIEIKLIEYRSPRIALATAKGSQATPNDPIDADIQSTLNQIQAAGAAMERAAGKKSGARSLWPF